MWWFIIFIFCSIHTSNSKIFRTKTNEILYEIAGIFEDNTQIQQRAFTKSMRQARLGLAELQSTAGSQESKTVKDWRLEPVILEPLKSDSYSIWRTLCSNKSMRPVAVFGPQNPVCDRIVIEQCALANIPHIQATWKSLDTHIELNQEVQDDNEENQEPVFKKFSINFYPPADEILYGYAKLLQFYNWEKFAVLYEDDVGLLRIQQILAHHRGEHPVTVRRLDPNANNYPIFKLLDRFKDNRIILDCHVDRLLKYLTEAKGVNMLTHYQHYILITMDATTLADELKKFNSNFTWLSLTEYDKLNTHSLAQTVGKWLNEKPSEILPPVTSFKLDALIMDDIANHVLKALKNVDTINSLQKPYETLCESNIWTYGAQFQEEILKAKTPGITGNIAFNEQGQRVNYTLYVNEINLSELETIGTWDSETKEFTEDRHEEDDLKYQKNSKHFIIIAKKAKPYFSDRVKCPDNDTDCVEETADEKYEGFCVDLIKDIFDNLRKYKFNYTYSFEHYDDKRNVKRNEGTRKWYGLIDGLVNDNRADLAVGDITITEERKKVVDFSVPFMSLGISILYTKEIEVKPGMFSFLNPYTFEVWMYTATAYCVVSMILFICSRISPADWENPQPCDKDPKELENIWNFKNCTWLTMGSIMCQGCDILPKAIGSRWVCAMWWFFAVIVCQTYIAQLSASMTSAMENEPINNVEDLFKRNKVLYGAIENGSTLDFFKNSKDKMYRTMYDNMMANPVVLVSTNEEGEKRVVSGKNKYAFFMESTSIEYRLRRNCDLKKIGEELDSKDYGIAMPANNTSVKYIIGPDYTFISALREIHLKFLREKGNTFWNRELIIYYDPLFTDSPFRTYINRAILELKENNRLDKIKKKWWEDKDIVNKCKEEKKNKNDVEGDLEMENMVGAFIVLIAGLVFSLLITAMEFLNEVRNIVVREQVTFKEVFIKELKSSLNFFQLQKPVIHNPSRAPSLASSNNSEKKENQVNLIENFLDFEKEML